MVFGLVFDAGARTQHRERGERRSNNSSATSMVGGEAEAYLRERHRFAEPSASVLTDDSARSG